MRKLLVSILVTGAILAAVATAPASAGPGEDRGNQDHPRCGPPGTVGCPGFGYGDTNHPDRSGPPGRNR